MFLPHSIHCIHAFKKKIKIQFHIHVVLLLSAYADEAQINPVPVEATPQFLQIEWTAKSETPITIFRVQFMVRHRETIIKNWIACYN